MSLHRIPFLLTSALCNHVAWTPPNPTPAAKEQTAKSGPEILAIGAVVKWGPFICKLMVWIATICEIMVTYARRNPTFTLSRTILNILVLKGSADNIHATQLFFIASFLEIFGGLFRLQSYRALGRLFTYVPAIRENHKLKTDGPYALVRHPSYTSLLVLMIGTVTSQLSAGSWITECGVLETRYGIVAVGAWLTWITYITVLMLWRGKWEDEMLKREFGKQWIEWADKVQYRIIPGVY